jgi:5-carboxymethyl-2-hydroxymuconate isomerase
MFLAVLETSDGEVIAAGDGSSWRRVGTPDADDIVELAMRAAEIDLPPLPQISEESRLRAPIKPGKIVAIGLNYMDHIREANAQPPARPLVFTKFGSSIIGPDEAIVIDRDLCERVDWEIELAVVIGREARRVPAEDALSYVAAYTIANDVSARDVQFSDGQWVRAKSFDTFCPIGPWLTTADAIPEPQQLSLKTTVNGELVQNSSTREMVFGVRELIEFCSASFTLSPGDVLLTGTPWGCGEFMQPQRSLQPGDVVECEIEQIGLLRNVVHDYSRSAP